MKTLVANLVFFCAIILFQTVTAQEHVPEATNYQAVLRDNHGEPMPNQRVTLRFTILDSTGAGTPLYQETDTVTSTGFGLLITEIGYGSPTIGTFAGIDWNTRAKYLQVELDLFSTGQYLTMGLSQLISVPYAKTAQFAMNLKNDPGAANYVPKYTLTGVLGSSSIYDNGTSVGVATNTPDNSARLDVSSSTQGFLPPRLTQAQVSSIATPATGLMLYNTTINKPQYYDGTGWKNFDGSHYIGELYAGGIVFYIDSTGQHGLVAATSDQNAGIAWDNGNNISTGATGTAIGSGASNTAAIITAQGAGAYAATACTSITLGGYNDWFLPSKDELNQMYVNLANPGIGGFASFTYWSSSESTNFNAWFQYLTPNTGAQQTQFKVTQAHVRAARAF
ncbi:MAG: hypothetical protein JWO06_3744 [Bacteroidota bacterium]|nr:hypothetical protein [Bacteroidota bacterium]